MGMNQQHLFDEDETTRFTKHTPFNGPRDQNIATPRALVCALESHLDVRFGLDAAAVKSTAVCANYLGPDHVTEHRRDAFKVDSWQPSMWADWVWLNPPFDDIKRWYLEALKRICLDLDAPGCVMLLPARTSMDWFHLAEDNRSVDVWFPRGRIDFKNTGKSPYEHTVVLVIRQ